MGKALKSLSDKPLLHLLLIAILGILIYSNTFNVPFYFDDQSYIVDSPFIKDLRNFIELPKGESSAVDMLSGRHVAHLIFKNRYIAHLTFALNYKLHGLNVSGYHIFNLAMHILNAILVYWLVVLTFKTLHTSLRGTKSRSNPDIEIATLPLGDHNDKTNSLLPKEDHRFTPFRDESLTGFTHSPSVIALFSALIFISHPIQTQAVTYITQRFVSLATFFYLLSLVMYIKFRTQGIVHRQKIFSLKSVSYYLSSVLSAVLAMKTKEMSFTLPIAAALYEIMFFEGKAKERILYLIPLLLTMLIIPLGMIGIDRPLGNMIGELREAAQETGQVPRWSYLFTQFRVIATYIRLLFFPINQIFDYDYPVYSSFFNPNVFLSFLFLASIFVLGVYLFYRSRYTIHDTRCTLQHLTDSPIHRFTDFRLISFGIFWFFITLSVESTIIPTNIIFEYRVYLPSVGVVAAFNTGIFYLISRHKKILLTANYLLFAGIVIALSIATYQRNTVYKDDVMLWEDVVRKAPYNVKAHNNLGLAYYDNGRLDEAIQEYKTVLALKFDFVEAHYNLGLAYYEQRRFGDAIKEYLTALKIKPDDAKLYNNLGNAYMSLGLIDNAIMHYRNALRLNSNLAETHYNLGIAYEQKGFIKEAIKEFQAALKLNPALIQAQQNLKSLQR